MSDLKSVLAQFIGLKNADRLPSRLGSVKGFSDRLGFVGRPLVSLANDGSISLPATATYGRTSAGFVLDYTGTYVSVAAGYPRFQGARYATNTAYWTLADGTALHPTRVLDGVTVFDNYPIWVAGTAYTAGQRVIPATNSGYPAGGDGYWYYCSTAGTSHAATEPTWAAGDVTDNTVTWTRGGYYRIAGYLHEQEEINLALRSNAFDTGATWPATAVDVGANAIAGPDGGPSADLVKSTGGSATHRVTQTIAYANATTYIHSVFVKKQAVRYVYFYTASEVFTTTGELIWDLDAAAAITHNPNSVTAGAEPLPNGWFRIWCVRLSTAAASGAWRIGVTALPTNVTSTVADEDGAYFWGAQLSARASLGSPITTAAAAVTRAADTLSLVAGTHADAAGCAGYDVQHARWAVAAGDILGDGTEAIAKLATTVSGVQMYDGTTTASGPVATPSGTMRHAVRWSAEKGKMQAAANGTVGTEADYDGSFNLSALIFGTNFNGIVRNLRITQVGGGSDKLLTLSKKDGV